jgi:hypothetical protein
MKYAILTETTTHELARSVNDYLSRGWIPCGGVAISTQYIQHESFDEERAIFAQAVMLDA